MNPIAAQKGVSEVYLRAPDLRDGTRTCIVCMKVRDITAYDETSELRRCCFTGRQIKQARKNQGSRGETGSQSK